MATRRRKLVRWSAQDLKTLRQLAGRKSVRDIGRSLKRSEAAVRYKAWAKRIRLAAK